MMRWMCGCCSWWRQQGDVAWRSATKRLVSFSRTLSQVASCGHLATLRLAVCRSTPSTRCEYDRTTRPGRSTAFLRDHSTSWLGCRVAQKRTISRVATNLEYSGISLNMENSWNSQGILCNLRENWLCALGAACVKQSICSQVYLVHKNCWFDQYGMTCSC